MKGFTAAFRAYFVPHAANNHAPHILRRGAVGAALSLVFVGELLFISGTQYFAPQSQLFAVLLTSALVDGTNQNRAVNNLPELRVSPLLEAAARAKANDMAKNGYFAHTSPAGLTPWYWFAREGYAFRYAGENLAVNFSDSEDVTNAWMSSPAHRENILRNAFTEIGVATAQGEYQGKPAAFVVQLFGTPATRKVFSALPVVSSTKPLLPAPWNAEGASPRELFAAVKGAAEEAEPPVLEKPAAPQNNPVQNAFASPRGLLRSFYLFLIGLFALALVLMVCIKFRLRNSRLLFGGALVIAAAGIAILINQHLSLFSASIL